MSSTVRIISNQPMKDVEDSANGVTSVSGKPCSTTQKQLYWAPAQHRFNITPETATVISINLMGQCSPGPTGK